MVNIIVKRPLEFLTSLIEVLPVNTLMSFEGELAGVLEPDFLYADKEIGKLIRGTRTPKQDFWVFKLDLETKNYLMKDFLHRIGIRGNVLHVLCEFEGEILFAAYDNFDVDSVGIKKTGNITDALLDGLAKKGIIKYYSE